MKTLTDAEASIVSGSGVARDIGKAVGEIVGSIVGAIANPSNNLDGAYGCAKTGVGCSSD